MKLRYSARTDVGRTRDHNEDNFGVGDAPSVASLGHLFVVCDGMGGHAAGEVASSLAVERILASYYDTEGEDRDAVLEQAIERANAWVHEEGRGAMGTTGVAALCYQNTLTIANVGDSRAYLLRGGQPQQISRDHSLVGDQIAAGLITPEQARSLHYRNVITRAIGYQPEVQVDLFRVALQPGDVVVLSSDGLHGLVEDAEIAHAFATGALAAAVEQLVQLANDRGGTDNITLIAIAIDELGAGGQNELRFDGGADPDAATQPSPISTADVPPAAAPPPPAPAAPTPADTARERRLTLPGFLLAAILLAALVGLILLLPSTVRAPAPVPTSVTATGLPDAAPTDLPATPSPTQPPTSTPGR